MKTTIFSFILLLTCLLGYGQDKASVSQKRAAPETYCDDYITEVKASLERLANNACKTVKKTIECTDRKSGLKVHVILVVQPTSDACKPSTTIDEVSEPASRGAAPDFSVEILQEPCSRGGISYTAFIPGYDVMDKKIAFEYSWLADGKPAGKERTIQCVQAKEIMLKVTNKATGQGIKKKILQESKASYKMFGFKKTACFGSCPVYEVTIDNSGHAIWNGKSNVKQEGRWEATIEKATLDRIKDQVFKLEYFDMNNHYPIEGQVADAAHTITYVRIGDMEKTIDHVLGGPDNLETFEGILENIIENASWTKVKDDPQK